MLTILDLLNHYLGFFNVSLPSGKGKYIQFWLRQEIFYVLYLGVKSILKMGPTFVGQY